VSGRAHGLATPLGAPTRRGPLARFGDYLRLVKFSHSVFALPFALMGAWIAAGGPPAAGTLVWIAVAAVAARTAAMGFNRLVDRQIDAQNPRTRGRELPAGVLQPGEVRWLVAGSTGVFLFAAWVLGPLCLAFAPAVLAVLFGYSFVKRFSALCHLVLGLALALAPLGAWLAVRGDVSGDLAPPLWLAAAVLTWVAGFDLLYALADIEFDRARGLHSIPARLGVGRSLHLSSALHLVTVFCLLAFARAADLGWIFALALGAAAVLLFVQHLLVRPNDLSRLDLAFFTLNGWVGLALFAGLALDLALLQAGTHG
jgi:4-hydroxybenzoate polyprenyltransferase